jgi:hypothetical protein
MTRTSSASHVCSTTPPPTLSNPLTIKTQKQLTIAINLKYTIPNKTAHYRPKVPCNFIISIPKVSTARVQCLTQAFEYTSRRMLKVPQRFGKHCSYHFQDYWRSGRLGLNSAGLHQHSYSSLRVPWNPWPYFSISKLSLSHHHCLDLWVWGVG